MSTKDLKNYIQKIQNSAFLLEPKEWERLVVLQTQYLIKIIDHLGIEKEEEPEIKEEGIDLIDFYVKTHICHPSSLAKLLTGNAEFFRLCGERRGKKYYVKPEATIKYLSTCSNPKFKNSALRFLKTRQEKPCPTKTQAQPALPLLLIS